MIRIFAILVFLQATVATAGFRRIVCLNPVLSEWVSEILGQSESLRRVVGVSEYSNHPAFLKAIPEVGPYPKLNVERIVALKPDLVLGSEEYNLPEQLAQISRLKLNLRTLKKESFHTMEDWIRSLGAALEEPAGASLARKRWTDLRSALARHRGPSVRVFIEVQHKPLIAVGGQSFLSEALETAGYENIFSTVKTGYPKVSIEAVLTADPERILILDHAGDPAQLLESRKEWMRFESLSAVRKDQVHFLSGDDFARCSLRLLNALKGLRSRHEDRTP